MTDKLDPRPSTIPASQEVAAVRAEATASERTVASDAPGRPADLPRTGPRESLDREEREIKDNVLRLGSLVAEHDADLALAVITGDVRLNEAQRLITALVARTIATQQPVARDLRFLLALDHVAYDLERMGDHASSVAKQARKLAPVADGEAHGRLAEMGRLMLSGGLSVTFTGVEQNLRG